MKFKKLIRQAAAFTLVSTLLLPNISALAAAFYESLPPGILGYPAQTSSYSIADNSTYTTTQSAEVSGTKQQTEQMVTFMPGVSGVTPYVGYGARLFGTSKISDTISYLRGLGKDVVAGINADFFSLESGLPLGIVITDGILRSSDAGMNAIGFMSDGRTIIGKPTIHIQMTANGKTTEINHLNKWRTMYGIYLLNNDFSASTRNRSAGIDVILGSVQGQTKIGGTVTAVVEEVTPYNSAISIPDGKMVLTVDNLAAADKVWALKSLTPGTAVSFTITCDDPQWETVQHAVGGGEILLSGGAVTDTLMARTDKVHTDPNPRTALGIKNDGTVLLYTVDGRQSGYSNGINAINLAKRLQELGCVSAINLDGGGSTAFTLRNPGYDSISVMNRPSDGTERKCANYIFLTNTAAPSGIPAHLFVYPKSNFMLSGATLPLTAKATDSSYRPAPAENVSYGIDWSNPAIGSVQNDGVFVAGAPGTGMVTAATAYASANANVTVLGDVTGVKVYNDKNKTAPLTSLTLSPGETVNLTAEATNGIIKPISSDNSFKWELSNQGLGTITPDGLFTAASVSGVTGQLFISYGTFKIFLNVKVGAMPQIVETFEGDFTFSSGMNAQIFKESSLDKVRYGLGSLKIDYNLTDGNAKVNSPVKLATSTPYLTFWLYGDGSGNQVNLSLASSSGNGEYKATLLDYTGWKFISVALPAGTTDLLSLNIVSSSAAKAGTIYVDQIICTYTNYEDTTSPNIAFAPEAIDVNGMLKVTTSVTDDDKFLISADRVVVSYDQQPVPYTYDPSVGIIQVNVKPDTLPHRLSVCVIDIAGNVAKASYDQPLAGTAAISFNDMTGHWAERYTSFMYQNGVASGELTGKGRFYYPTKNMTRAEFAVVMVNSLGLDSNLYTDSVVPFADFASIPEWAQGQAKTAFVLGLITGRKNDKGEVMFDPGASVTRAEVMTIIGRSQQRGFAEAQLSFADSADIPAWAAPYAKTLLSQHVFTGYPDNTIKPNNKITRAEVAKIIYTLY